VPHSAGDDSAGPSHARAWRFGQARFDEERLELQVRGKPVRIERKSIEVLRHLLLRAGKVVTKDELLKAVWPGRVLSDSTLTTCVRKLREALGDDARNVIRTVHGYGYQLAAAVDRAAPDTDASPPPPAAPAAAAAAGTAEHRQITVLFCDLVDSTRLAESLDAETYRDVILAYQAAATAVIERYEGHVAQYLGDGLLVYFGYPQAHDDDAERAVRAGCEIKVAVARLSNAGPRLSRPLATRIGIHTGPVVVGSVGAGERRETLALGGTTNIAARLEAVAEPNSVLISAATMRLVPGLFVTRDLGEIELRGLERRVHAHQVVMPSGVRTRLEAAARLTPLVGRTGELALLQDRWHSACAGAGQAVLISAEPGVGKSRLMLALRERLAATAHTWLECRATPLARNTAFQSIVELIYRGFAINDRDDAAARRHRLEVSIDSIDIPRDELIGLLAPLLSLEPAADDPTAALGPEQRRARTIDTLVTWIVALARQQPVVLVVEDLHWADASTRELLQRLIEQAPTSRLLMLMTGRPEFRPPWPIQEHFTALPLARLRSEDAGVMLESLCGATPLPAPVARKILDRAGGVPLFLEELARAVLESGPALEQEIPATLQDSLTARMDRLGVARSTLQVCAVIGREVPHRLLAAVTGDGDTRPRAGARTAADAGNLTYVDASSRSFCWIPFAPDSLAARCQAPSACRIQVWTVSSR
jgi:class 3 adenylate cyclase